MVQRTLHRWERYRRWARARQRIRTAVGEVSAWYGTGESAMSQLWHELPGRGHACMREGHQPLCSHMNGMTHMEDFFTKFSQHLEAHLTRLFASVLRKDGNWLWAHRVEPCLGAVPEDLFSYFFPVLFSFNQSQ